MVTKMLVSSNDLFQLHPRNITALENGNVDSCIEIIKNLEKCSFEAKTSVLQALMVCTSTYFDSLEYILKATGDIVSKLLCELKKIFDHDINFHRLLSISMKSLGRGCWFSINDTGK